MGSPIDEPILVQKARSALRAARAVVRAHPESAVSRSYYAVHHALRWRYGGDLPRGHGGITDPVVLTRASLDSLQARQVESLYVWRHRADYGADRRVPPRISVDLLDLATGLLRRLGVSDL